MLSRALTALLAVFALAAALSAQGSSAPTIFLVRHAERADAGGAAPTMNASDPDLSPAGHARATSLAAMLKDAGIAHIFATEAKRTQQTAAPAAEAFGVKITTVPAKDLKGLLEQLKKATGNVLVVGHSNTVPDAIKALGITDAITIGDTEFDNLFVVVPGTQPKMVRLRYQ